MRNFQFILYIVYAILIIIVSYGKRITIKSSDFGWKYDLGSIINRDQGEGELTVYFPDEEYNMSVLNFDTIIVNVEKKVTFLGNENGTIFNYKYDRRGPFSVSISKKAELFKMENIIFEKYKNDRASDGVQIMFLHTYSDDFQFLVKNCTFRDNDFKLFRIDVQVTKNYKNNWPYILFDHCKFM